MKTNEQLMKACQIGCNNLSDANNLLAECYGRIGMLTEESERLRGWIRVEGARNDTCTRQILGEICDGCRCGKAQKDAARGAK